ncbi:MAG: hypothetical protein PUC59_08265 [Firmicutes bacterium]|nr:hypothetical protein [Bacillota bacterium]
MMDPKPWNVPEIDPDSDAEKEKRRREREKKYGYLQQNLDGIIEVFPKMNDGPISTDVLGSYTGTPDDGRQPTQDADDL